LAPEMKAWIPGTRPGKTISSRLQHRRNAEKLYQHFPRTNLRLSGFNSRFGRKNSRFADTGISTQPIDIAYENQQPNGRIEEFPIIFSVHGN
jgi:hypothetical protein